MYAPLIKNVASRLYSTGLNLSGIEIGANFKSNKTDAMAKIIEIDIIDRSFTVLIFIGGKPAAIHKYKSVTPFVDEYTPEELHFGNNY